MNTDPCLKLNLTMCPCILCNLQIDRNLYGIKSMMVLLFFVEFNIKLLYILLIFWNWNLKYTVDYVYLFIYISFIMDKNTIHNIP